MKPTIITFSGKAQAGKDSSANILKEILKSYDYTSLRINYADYLKYLAEKYYGWNGEKDKNGRTLLQKLGSKIRKRHPDFWVDNVINTVKALENDFDYILIGDCRYPNEVSRWVEEDYYTIPIHVERFNVNGSSFDNGLTLEQKKHISETAMDDYHCEQYLKACNLYELEREIIDKVLPIIGLEEI